MNKTCGYCLLQYEEDTTEWHWVRLKALRRGYTRQSIRICHPCSEMLVREQDYITGRSPDTLPKKYDPAERTKVEEFVKVNTVYLARIKDAPYRIRWEGAEVTAATKQALVEKILRLKFKE